MESLYDYKYETDYHGFEIWLMFDPMHPPQVHYKVTDGIKFYSSGPNCNKEDAIMNAKKYISSLYLFGYEK